MSIPEYAPGHDVWADHLDGCYRRGLNDRSEGVPRDRCPYVQPPP